MAAAAAVVGGMVASGVIKVVIKQIGSAIGGKIKLHKKLTEDLEKLKMTLESVEAALSDAERRSITDRSALLWVNRLKAAMYDISDMLDDYESDASLFGAMRKKINMPDKMKKMQESLQKITEDRQNYCLPPETHTNEHQLPDIRENAGTIEEAEIIGRAKEKLEILARLSGSTTERTTFLPIWGFGGIGKTTLARSVYNDPEFKNHSRVWVYVSQIFDLKFFGKTIISQLSSINICLQKLLTEKKNILIILDDLWEKHPSQLEQLKDMLKQGEGCKVTVVVTTRDEGIANEIGTVQPYNLPQLSDEMCWDKIRQKSKFETRDDKQRLEPIGRDIAKKCRGVALAAQSLGHMLKSRPHREWNSVKANHIWDLSTSTDASPGNEVLGSLQLSYNFMPPYLKLCFAYCAIFPKGHKMIKYDLIHQRIALGFFNIVVEFGRGSISARGGLPFPPAADDPHYGGPCCERK
ncbi:unnamed protein product [Triticum turgidum subsp. durum]|uniref:Uncharacterized protein n=1 Tax=Triticum turgidum subsp. durum TaxID=4567 RepID=A0A9R0Z3A9_TRITD|nr:unnamed protein product [Triticum turgidum subsp. durum]